GSKLALRGEYIDFILIQVKPKIFYKFGCCLRSWIIEYIPHPAHKFVQRLRASALFIFPVSGQALFCNIVHLLGTYLHLYLPPLLGYYRSMERLVAICFGDRNKITKPFGNGRIPICDDGVYAPAIFLGMW